jgi:hypothetical protein
MFGYFHMQQVKVLTGDLASGLPLESLVPEPYGGVRNMIAIIDQGGKPLWMFTGNRNVKHHAEGAIRFSRSRT